MRLTVLGNNGPYPAPGGVCSGYLLESDSGDTKILIDCGTSVLNKLLALTPIEELDAVVLSHLHYDHMSDMLPLQYALQFHPRKKALSVFAPDEPSGVRALLINDLLDLWPMRDATVNEMRLSFSPTRHPVETYAVSVECDGARLVYTGDSNTELSLELFCDRADLLLADCGLSAADYTEASPHFSAPLCGKLASDAQARQLLLTHFNPKYNPKALLKEARAYYPKAELAELDQIYYI